MTRTTVETLRLNQFRSYASAVIDSGGAPVALYGPNGAGKTNVLEALSLLVPGRGLRRAGSEELVRRPDQIGWRIRAEIAGADGMVEVVTGTEAGSPGRSVQIDGKGATQTALGHLIRMVWLTPAMDRLWLEGAGERRRFLDRITLGFYPGHAEASVNYEKAMRERNRLLRDGIGDPAWLGGLEAQMSREGARIARARAVSLARLETAQNQAQTLFPKAEMAILGDMETRFAEVIRNVGFDSDEMDALESEEAAGLSARLGAGRGRDAAAGRTLSGPHRSDLDAVYAVKSMPARACSTGEQKALLISLILANARALADAGTTPVVLLDEVAAHLDAGRRAALYAEIEALGCQAWMTGTGPELFEELPANTLRLSVLDDAGQSRLEPA
ncbi:DNA replication/repair protein RecF [Rhodobacteraceae bacterium NNCM2]|nr:DNA replication/repair protein RecF [Coraliihabitans acroporae]